MSKTYETHVFDEGDGSVLTLVGREMLLIDMALFLGVHEGLADEYRARGLTGSALDQAIVAAMPLALASKLYGATYH